MALAVDQNRASAAPCTARGRRSRSRSAARMEPAAMLVRTFEIKVGREYALFGMRAAHHRPGASCRNRTRRRACRSSCGIARPRPEQSFRVERNQPSMPVFSTRWATCSISSGVRGCSAPVSCAGRTESARPSCAGAKRTSPDASSSSPPTAHDPRPGRTAFRRRHARRPSAASARSRRLVLHADEPLRRGAEDDRRLVAPAVRIAVADLLGLEQHAAPGGSSCSTSGLAFPNRLAGDLADRQRGTLPRNLPSSPTGLVTGRPYFLPTT